MKYKLIFLPEALLDADEIRQYLSQYYDTTVKKLFTILKKRIGSLKSNPYLAPPHIERPPYHRLVVEDYLVFYKVDDNKKTIEIHRILHGSRDVERFI